MSYLLGIDLGTSSLKTIVMSQDGKILSSDAVDYQFDSPVQGYAEQDPQVWWQACVSTIRNAVAKAAVDVNEIAALGFSGQMHGVVMLDRDCQVIRPAILHCDARSEDQVKYLNETIPLEKRQRLFRNPVYPGFMLTSLLWVRDNEPENYERIAHVCSPKDYIRYLLCGVFSSEYSDASATLLFDIEKNTWSEEILSLTGLPRDIYPKCTEPTALVGTLTASAAELTSLARKTRVAAGGGDLTMMAVGNGMVRNGDGILNIGTSGQVSFQIDRPVINPALNTNMFSSYHSGRWVLYGATMSAGLCLKWWRQTAGNPSYKVVNELTAKAAPGSGGVIFYPYLNGERCPHLMSDISSCFLGVNASTGFGEMTRAVMEGVVFNLRQCAEVCAGLGFSANTYLASGGAARSDVWTQIMADVFNRPIKRVIGEEQACLGAALTAGVAAGMWNSIPEAADAVVRYQDRVFLPDPRTAAVYDEYYQLFRDTFPQFSRNLRRLTNLGRSFTSGK
ncbi:MAG: xylulokinase [Anaerolineaceae bacterium]|nr:xylulokinase [Anaerolineaceae bacterium]